MKLEVPNYKLLAVERVHPAGHNPPGRTDPRRLRDLVRSMSEIGLVYPIIVDPSITVIDGHRRLAAAKLLGWEAIPAIVRQGDRDRIYASVNVTAAKMKGAESLGVWLKNPAAVSPRLAKLLAQMEAVLGREMVAEMHEAGLSSRAYQTARRVARYCGGESDDAVRAALRWLMDVAVIGQVMKALEAGVPPRTVRAAMAQKKPLTWEN